MSSLFYSIVVPVFNEEDNVAKLHQEIVQTLKKLKGKSEIIFVNDGSTDNTLQQLKKLNSITIINLRKNSGQSAALDAGIKYASGKIIVTLDGDGQNNPADIPRLLSKLNGEVDVVCGWRANRKDPFSKRFVSGGARWLRGLLVKDGVHDAGCTLRVYKREVFEDLDLQGEMHRMLPALLKWRGFNVVEEKVGHRKRRFGRTKYNWKRIIKGFIDMLQIWFWRKYESRPLYLFGTLGLFLIGTSSLLIFILGIARMFYGYSLSDKIWPLIGITAFLAGVQFLVFGLLSDLIIKNRPGRSYYKIREIIKR